MVEERRVEIHGVAVHYLAVGEGEPVVALHGAARPASLKAPVRKRNLIVLAEHGFRVYAPDLPGFGRTPLPPSYRSFDSYSQFLDAFTGQLGLDAVHLLGTSMGGAVALLTAAEHPAKVSRLAVVGSAGLSLPHAPIRFSVEEDLSSLAWRAFYDKRVAELYVSSLSPSTPEEEAAFRSTMQTIFHGQPLDLRAKIASITRPTLIVWGDRDEIIPVAHAYELQRLIRGSRLHIVTGAGHLPQVEKPREIYALVASFFKGGEAPLG